MTMLAAELGLIFAPLAGFLTFNLVESTTDSTPWIAGIAAVLVTGFMVPTVKWIMNRVDVQSQQQAEAAARREKREDDRNEAFQKQVAALDRIVLKLDDLDDRHKEMLAAIQDLPDQIRRHDGI